MNNALLYRWNPADVIYRQGDGGAEIIDSKIVPYWEWNEIDSVFEGNFMERFGGGSLKKTFQENLSRIRVYFEHGYSKIYDSQPIAEVLRAWEEPDAAWFSASLLDGLPDLLRNGIKKGLYGASIGAKVIKAEINEKPKPSAYNPKGLEERTYTEVQAHDFSLTPRPAYASTSVSLRSITDELAIERLVKDPDRLLELLRSAVQEGEPEHSSSEETESGEEEQQQEEAATESQDDSESEESRATRHVKDYLADESEDTWRV